MKSRSVLFLIIFCCLFGSASFAAPKIPAVNIIATDKNNVQRNLQDILNQILPTNSGADLSNLTATGTELNVLDGVNTSNVTAARLNTLMGGAASDASTLHIHTSGVTADNAQLLDSIDSPSFLRSDTSDSFSSGTLTFDNATLLTLANTVTFQINNNTISGGTAAIDFTDFDVSSDGVITLAPDTDANTITISPSSAFTTDAIDLSSANIGNALNVGANTITGTAFNINATAGDLTLDPSGDVVVSGADWSVTAAGAPTFTGVIAANGGINLSGGTVGGANTLDFGSGSADDFTATDVIDLTDGGATTLHSHAAGDATTLDSIDSLSFLRSDANDSLTTPTKLTIDSGARLSIYGGWDLSGTGVDATATEINLLVGKTSVGGTLDEAYNLDTSGDAQITVDTRDVSFDLNDATNDYKVSIDNTTTGVIAVGFEVTASGAGATITTAIDLTDPDIVNAFDIGANKITGTNLKFDGTGQITLGAGGGGGGGVGTGILTFKGGGTIDSTSDGDIIISPQDAGIVDFPAGTTVRLPQASPAENRNGLYWDQVNSKLCIDKATDICTGALTLASASLNSKEVALLSNLVKDEENVKKLNKILSNTYYVDKFEKLMQMPATESLQEGAALSSIVSKKGYLYTQYLDSRSNIRKQFIETSSRPYVFERDSAQLIKGEVFIEFNRNFLELMDMNPHAPNYKVQVTPTSFDIIGPLAVKKFENGFKVVDIGGKTDATFDWEVTAFKKKTE